MGRRTNGPLEDLNLVARTHIGPTMHTYHTYKLGLYTVRRTHIGPTMHT